MCVSVRLCGGGGGWVLRCGEVEVRLWVFLL